MFFFCCCFRSSDKLNGGKKEKRWVIHAVDKFQPHHRHNAASCEFWRVNEKSDLSHQVECYSNRGGGKVVRRATKIKVKNAPFSCSHLQSEASAGNLVFTPLNYLKQLIWQWLIARFNFPLTMSAGGEKNKKTTVRGASSSSPSLSKQRAMFCFVFARKKKRKKKTRQAQPCRPWQLHQSCSTFRAAASRPFKQPASICGWQRPH